MAGGSANPATDRTGNRLRRILDSRAPRAVVLIRMAVGIVFLFIVGGSRSSVDARFVASRADGGRAGDST